LDACDKITIVLRNMYMLPACSGQTMTTELNHCVSSSIGKLVLRFPIAHLKLHAQREGLRDTYVRSNAKMLQFVV